MNAQALGHCEAEQQSPQPDVRVGVWLLDSSFVPSLELVDNSTGRTAAHKLYEQLQTDRVGRSLICGLPAQAQSLEKRVRGERAQLPNG